MEKEVVRGKYFTYEFYEQDRDDVRAIEEKLQEKAPAILEWFSLTEVPADKRLVIYPNVEEYKKYNIPWLKKEGREYQSWMVGDSFDGNVNMLSFKYANGTPGVRDFNAFIKTPVHELVHICQQLVGAEYEDKHKWLWEGLATYFAEQKQYSLDYIDASVEQIQKEKFCEGQCSNIYAYGYTMVGKMMKMYSREEMLEFIKDPESINVFEVIEAVNLEQSQEKQ